MKQEYIIAICNTEADGVVVEKVIGTEDEVKAYLFSLVKEDREEYENSYGKTCFSTTETVDNIEKTKNGELNAYNTFRHFHIDYTARPITSITTKEL